MYQLFPKEEWQKTLSDYTIRRYHIDNYGFPIITLEVANILTEFLKDKSVVDLGCGSGYISAVLSKLGVADITAVDNNERAWGKAYFDIVEEDMLEHDISSYDVVLLSWPDYCAPEAAKIAEKLTSGQILIFQGESRGGCTADEDFFKLINSDKFLEDELSIVLASYHARFWGIHDSWHVLVRR